MLTKRRFRQLLEGLRDRARRALFVETEIESLLPFQIQAMRKRHGWTQKDLAKAAGMNQGRISLLENPNYEGKVNVKTLVKLAAAFDVALLVRFVPFSELAEWTSKLSLENHDVPDFDTEWKLVEDESLAYHEFKVSDATAVVPSQIITGPWKDSVAA